MSSEAISDPFEVNRDDLIHDHVELIGPFETTYVVLNGFRVPHLTGYTRPGGVVTLVVDNRFAYDFPVAHYEQIVCAIANAVAVERGYSHFPSGRDEIDLPRAYPFGGQWHGIETEEHE